MSWPLSIMGQFYDSFVSAKLAFDNFMTVLSLRNSHLISLKIKIEENFKKKFFLPGE